MFCPKETYLLVDDIYDTGKTINFILNHYKCYALNLIPCTLLCRGLNKNIISGNTLFHNNWIDFWWEIL